MIMTHEPVSLDPRAHLGVDTVVWQFATIEAHVVCGAHCVIGSGVWIGAGTIMGDDVRIQHGAFVCRMSEIGHRVFIGPNVTLTDDKYPRVGHGSYTPQPPIIEDDCAIGAGAVICPGVRLGRGTLVGAGAVVTQDTLPDSVMVGVPARELAHNPKEYA